MDMTNYRVLTSTRIEYTSTADEMRTFAATGRFFYCGLGSDIYVTVFDMSNRKLMDQFRLTAGRGVKFPEASDLLAYKIQIKSPTAQAISVDVLDGEIVDNTVIISNTSILQTRPGAGGSWSDVAGTAVGAGACVSQANLAADSKRALALIGNPATSANPIYVRFNNTAAVSPLAIAPGSAVQVEGIQAIYVYNPGGAAITPVLQSFG